MSSGGGKGGGGGGSTMNDYYGDVAGVICSGPIDRLVAIVVDGKQVWPESGPGLDRAGQPNPVQLTITGYGSAWLYWGDDTQTLDDSGEALLASGGHPPYRRQAVLVLKSFLFGREKVSAPSVECIVRRTPVQSIVGGAAAALDADGQANPLAVLAELLTHPIFGLGLPTSDFDTASWQATADALYARAATTYISPVFDRPASVRSLVDELRGYFDGWFRADTAARIVAGRFLHGESAPAFTSANTLTADDLLEEPSLDAKGWADTLNEVAVKFADSANAYLDSAFTLTSGYNRQLTGEPRQTNFERPHITRRAQIASLAAEFLKIAAQPGFTASLVVRAAKGINYPVGTLLKFTHDLLLVDLVCRVINRTEAAPPSERVTLQIEAERGVSATPTPAVSTATQLVASTGIEALPRYYFAMPPAALFGESYLIVPLVERRSAYTLGFNVHLRSADTSQFQELGGSGLFAVRGSVLTAYAAQLGDPDDDSETLRLALDADIPAGDLSGVTQALTEDEVRDDTLLLWLVSALNPDFVEILSVRALRLSGGQWFLKVRRARGGTTAATFSPGDAAWLIRRDHLVSFRHAGLAALATAQATVTLRLQPIGYNGQQGDLANTALCPDLPLRLRLGMPADVTSFTVEGDRFTWSPVADRAVVGYRLKYQPGTRQEWTDAAAMHTGLITTSPYQAVILPNGLNNFLLKAVDLYGVESRNSALIQANLGDPIVANVVETFDRRAAAWPGTRIGFTIDGSNNLAAGSLTAYWAADDTAPMWSGDSTLPMWPSQTFAASTYIDSITVTQALAGSTMTLITTVAGDPCKIEYRENSASPMWQLDNLAAYWTDDAAAYWDVPDWQPWPGQITVPGNTIYDFRISTGEAQTQGLVSAFAIVIDAPDIAENFNDLVLASVGTRLPLTKTYRVIKNVSLTLQQDGNGASAVQVMDKLKTGPLIQARNSAGTAVAALIDARIQGY